MVEEQAYPAIWCEKRGLEGIPSALLNVRNHGAQFRTSVSGREATGEVSKVDHQLLLDSVGKKLENFLSTKTVVGEPITIGEVTLVPVQTAAFGFGSGGGESGKDEGAGGGAGGGASLRPIAIVAVVGTDVRVFSMGKKGALEGLIELIPDALSKVNFGKCKDKEDKSEEAKSEEAESCCCEDEESE